MDPVLLPRGNRADGTLGGFAVDAGTAIALAQRQGVPPCDYVANGGGQVGPVGNLGQCLLQPSVQAGEQRRSLRLPHGWTDLRRLTSVVSSIA